MQASVPPKVADDDQLADKQLTRAGVPYCAACKSLISCDERLQAHSGWLQRKKSKFHLKTKRFFMVVDGHVLYYASSSDVGRFLPKGVLHLFQGAVSDSDVGDNQQTFYVSGIGQKPLKLEANNESEKRQWLRVLSSEVLAAKPQTGCLSVKDQAHARLCSECCSLVNLDIFNLGSHVGWLTKQGGDIKTWKKRWVVLSNDHMCYYHSPDDVAVFKPINMLHVLKTDLVENSSKPFMFSVNSGNRTFYFVCDNAQDHKEWVEALHIKL